MPHNLIQRRASADRRMILNRRIDVHDVLIERRDSPDRRFMIDRRSDLVA